MYYKVKIKSLPKAKVGYQVDGSLKNDVTSFGGKNNGLQDHSNVKVTKSITAVPRKDANLEAEGGETVIGNIDGSKIPSFFNIEGPRHTKGGVPLNLPDDSFIFSDTRAMMINDPVLLKMFNMPTKKGGYTPAEMSKKFDINRYREILQDRNSDKLDIKTAEMMIKNYVIKLGALALAQESRKGFPQGIPKLSEPYMEANGITEEDLIPQKENPKDQQQSNNNGAGNKKEKTKEMPNGEPTAQPQEEMMQYGGGIRRLRRAQEGMQQPSEEEMMMMQQQQAQQQPQQGGQDQQMMQIMQQVGEALQQGAQPEELTAELLQGQVPPEAIMQIFAQLGMPENQVQQLVIGVMQQMQGGQEQDPRQQQQQISEEDMMAMQQQDPRQMQQAPMAAYGMSMGGYDMPDYMAYGGSLRKAQGGEEVKGKRGNITANKVGTIGADYTRTTTTSGKKAGYKLTEAEKRANAKGVIGGGGGGRPSPGWEDAICEMIKAGATYEQLTDPDVAFEFTGIRKTHMAPGADSKAIFDRCNVNASKFEDKEEAVYIDEEGKKCICLDKDGKAILDENGAEIPTSLDPTTGECIKDDPKCNPKTDCVPDSKKYNEEKAKCDAKGLEFDGPKCQCKEKKEECTPDTDLYNSRKAICDEKGEEFDPSTCDCIPIPPPRKPPEWWLQDNVNVMGAASDLASVKKYMPWEARVDLEEPRPTFLDPTRELGAQSEQANIASQASASFAGAQGLGARNAATQGNAAAQAANTLSNINNQNVNIANQFEGTQVGIRNQESMLNQQMANRVYDKNTIANQQFDNAKLQGRQNLRNSYNTAVTNKWKTDALNQMYPNYQTRPGVGGRVEYTPTDKTLDSTKRRNTYADAEEHCAAESGTAKQNCIKNYMDYNAKYGGESFEYGGYVYTVYPNY
jgi:hypothetical protein